jgi:transposase
MSKVNVKAFFRFCRVKVIDQAVDIVKKTVKIKVTPDKRYTPICHSCKLSVKDIHSRNERTVRDMNIFDAKTFVSVGYRTVKCPQCGDVVEDMGIMNPYKRVTRRLATYIIELCRLMSIKEVANHLDLDWKTVKEIHKGHLVEKFANEDIGNPRLLAVDEISLKKRHHYLTVIINWETGKVLWVGEGRKYETLKGFFDSITEEQIHSIEAIAMDMWKPYIKAVKECCPEASIVFDQFHVVQSFGRVIDKVRTFEYRKADKEGKEIIKGSKYLLLKNRTNLRKEEKPRLRSLLKINEAITTVYILKDYLKKLWKYRYPKRAESFLNYWCSLAEESKIRPVMAFAKTLKRYAYGIINHCTYPLHTSRLEGINNKIKVIKRRAYGFHDTEYFSLIIKSAFALSN